MPALGAVLVFFLIMIYLARRNSQRGKTPAAFKITGGVLMLVVLTAAIIFAVLALNAEAEGERMRSYADQAGASSVSRFTGAFLSAALLFGFGVYFFFFRRSQCPMWKTLLKVPAYLCFFVAYDSLVALFTGMGDYSVLLLIATLIAAAFGLYYSHHRKSRSVVQTSDSAAPVVGSAAAAPEQSAGLSEEANPSLQPAAIAAGAAEVKPVMEGVDVQSGGNAGLEQADSEVKLGQERVEQAVSSLASASADDGTPTGSLYWQTLLTEKPNTAQAIVRLGLDDFAMLSDLDARQRTETLIRMASEHQCSIDDLRSVCLADLHQLQHGPQSLSIVELITQLKNKQETESLVKGVRPENTSAAILLRWLDESLKS
jgi:hypothetical protein